MNDAENTDLITAINSSLTDIHIESITTIVVIFHNFAVFLIKLTQKRLLSKTIKTLQTPNLVGPH